MIEMKAVVEVKGVSAKSLIDFMLNCTDEMYQQWWPGTHLAFHTLKRQPSQIGNLVYFDEYVGKRRLKFEAVIVEYLPAKKIVWQMKKVLLLPGWLALEIEETPVGLTLTHVIRAGFGGFGSVLDPLLRLYLSQKFEKDLEEHAHYEFHKLAEILEKSAK